MNQIDITSQRPDFCWIVYPPTMQVMCYVWTDFERVFELKEIKYRQIEKNFQTRHKN